MSASEIASLQQTLNTALDAFRASLSADNIPEPVLSSTSSHPFDSPTFLPSPALFEARKSAIAAMGLLTTLVESPFVTILQQALCAVDAAAMRTVVEAGVSDAIAEYPDADRTGVPLEELAKKVGLDSAKLERVIRLLITQGFYREPALGRFANTRLSNLIKNGTPGWQLHMGQTEVVSRSAAYLPEHLLHSDPAFRNGTDPSHCALNLAFKTNLPLMGAGGWVASSPERTAKFSAAMGAAGALSDPGVIAGFAWDELAGGKDAVIDIGGGRGTLCCSLAHKYPNLPPLVVQDLEATREVAETFIASRNLSDRVAFEAHDFFQPQSPTRAGKFLYVIQRVLHDWGIDDNAKILGNLTKKLRNGSSLLIVEAVIYPALTSSSGPALSSTLPPLIGSSANVYTPIAPPPYVPADFGAASLFGHRANVALTALCNNAEFTVPHLEATVARAGMKIKAIHPTRGWACVIEVVAA